MSISAQDVGPRSRWPRSAILSLMDAMTAARARADRFLAQEPVVWLSSVRPDGRPHIVPVWFTWDGEALVVYSKPHAQKVRNVQATPVVMLALGDADEDFDVGLIEARASVVDTPATLPEAHVRKYGRRMAALGLSAEDFLATYSTVLRIVPTRYLPWHGRTTPLSVQATSSIEEPARPAARESSGEPLARRLERALRPSRPYLPGWLGEPIAAV